MNIQNWKSKHKNVDLLGQNLSYIDTEIGDKVLFIIHGYGSNSYDYHKVLNQLKKRHRVIIPDLIGFGLSSKPKKYYFSIIDQAQILAQLMKLLNIQEVSFISQGISSSVFCEILSLIKSKYIELEIRNIYLLNLSLSLELSSEKVNQDFLEKFIASTFLKMSISDGMFKKYIKKSFYNDTLISDEELNVYWNLMNYNNGIKTLKFIDYAIVECEKFGDRWLKNLTQYASKVNLIWGVNEVSDQKNTAHKIQKLLNLDTKHLFYLEDCGYFSMLEKPSEFIDIVQKVEM